MLITGFLIFCFVSVVQSQQNIEDIKIVITFDDVPSSYSVTKAPLKYNKQFALSFQVDDGTVDIYNKVFPYFSYLFYTDGCGNDIAFTASSSVYCFQEPGENGPDMHDPTDPSFDNTYLTWDDIKILYNNKYGVFNYGVSGKASTTDNWMDYSIGRNRSFMRRRLYSISGGREISNAFVCPNQLQEWTQPAFDKGCKIVLNKKDNGPIGLNGGNVNATTNWNEQKYIKRREAHRVVPVPEYVDELFNQSIDGANYWGSIFTHLLVDVDEGEHYPVGIFQNDFSNIAATYGRGSLDNILVASDEEIYDYLNIRDAISLVESLSGNILEITLSGGVPDDLRYYAMSLLVESDVSISSINVEGSDAFSKNESTGLVNFSWDDQIIPDSVDLAESFTSDAELSNSQYDAWIAMDYVFTLPLGEKKVELVNRLCGLEGLSYEDGFCEITLDTIVEIVGDTIICLGDTAILTATQGMDAYSWSDGQATQIIKINPTETTVYSVTSSYNGNISSDEVTVIVNPVPNIVSHSNETINHITGKNDTLWVSTLNDEYTYLWNTGGEDSAIIVAPSFSSEYYVDVSNQYECSARQEFKVVVDRTFQFTFDSVCFGGTTHLLNNSTYPDSVISVTWDLNSDGVFDDAEGNEVEKDFEEAGNHLVGMRSILFEGGIDVVFNVVPVGDYPVVDFGVDNTCIPGSTNFDDNSTVIVGENDSWVWNFGDGGTDESNFVSHTYFTVGDYDVKLVVSSSIGCKDSLTKQITIGESPNFEILDKNNDILYANDTTKINKNDSLYVTIQNSSTYDSIVWNNEINKKFFFVTEEGAFSVDVYNTVCSNSRIHYMKFNDGGGGEPTTNEIMNLFTPNGDGYNDKWVVNDPNISGNIKVNIYNRFGNEVYSSGNYNNDWQGIFNNNPLPQATYYYVIEDEAGTLFKGPVTILR